MTPSGPEAVVAGVGQVANKDDERIVHPVCLLEEAARAALADAGVTPGDVGAVLAAPLTTSGADDPSELVGERLGLAPGLRSVSAYSGAAPQGLIARACRLVGEGDVRAVLVVGGIADASVARALRRGIQPPAPPTGPWSQGAGSPGTRARGAAQPLAPETASGAGMPVAYFALVESALAAGEEVAARREWLGHLLAPFTDAAARRPHLAWLPERCSADELSRPSPGNRMVAEPYTKRMCSFPTVDQAAALVVARPGGRSRPGGQAVRPLAIVTAREAGPPSTWPAMGRSGALDRAVDHALCIAGIGADDITVFDLYSCFPAAVQLALRAFGVDGADPRGRTVTGGLPYFGGPGAAYALHAVACLVDELRAGCGSVGAVVGVGGMVTDFSVGLYAVSDAPVRTADLGDATPGAVSTVPGAQGRALVEAMTVLHERDRGPVGAPVVVRLPDGSRTGARAADPTLPAALSGTSLVGQEVELVTTGTKVTYTPV